MIFIGAGVAYMYTRAVTYVRVAVRVVAEEYSYASSRITISNLASGTVKLEVALRRVGSNAPIVGPVYIRPYSS